MDEVTGIFGTNDKFRRLLAEAQKRTARRGIKAAVVGLIDEDGNLWVEWAGVSSQALGIISRLDHEVHVWLDEDNA